MSVFTNLGHNRPSDELVSLSYDRFRAATFDDLFDKDPSDSVYCASSVVRLVPDTVSAICQPCFDRMFPGNRLPTELLDSVLDIVNASVSSRTHVCTICKPTITVGEYIDLTVNKGRLLADANLLRDGTCADKFLRELGITLDHDGILLFGDVMHHMARSASSITGRLFSKDHFMIVVFSDDPELCHVELASASTVSFLVHERVSRGLPVRLSTSMDRLDTLDPDFEGVQIVTLLGGMCSTSCSKKIVRSPHRLSNQFLKPTRFESAFETAAKFEVMRKIAPTYVADLRSLVAEASKVKNCGDRYVNMMAEPGTGKTLSFPFSFGSSTVAVVLPTSFDAWSAYSAASGPANLCTYTNKVSNSSNVTYMDSYTAGYAIAKKTFRYDIMIVDESDSSAGITSALVELDIPKTFVVHVSGTSATTNVETSSAFSVECIDDMPQVTEDFSAAVDYVIKHLDQPRNIIMAPDPAIAKHISAMLKNSTLLSAESQFADFADLFENQDSPLVLVTDDTCARGVNLNVDSVFDFQLVGSSDQCRVITKSEMRQRRGRVGRLKSGRYFCTGETLSSSSFTELDVFRSNVARAAFGIPLHPCSMVVDVNSLSKLLVSDFEPYFRQLELVDTAAKPRKNKRTSGSSVDLAPAWVKYVAGYKPRARSSTSSSSSAAKSKTDIQRYSSSPEQRDSSAVAKGDRALSSSSCAFPSSYTIPSRDVAPRPPTIDLSQCDSDVSWASALAEILRSGDKLPQVVPRSGWAYSASSRGGVDFIQKLKGIVQEGTVFSEPEFELVARAWNLLVARRTFSMNGTSDVWNDERYLQFCVEYFESYLTML